jgi:HEAT repeat protein
VLLDGDEVVRVGACILAGWTGGEEQLTHLAAVLTDYASSQVRFAAGVALTQAASDGLSLPSGATDALLAALLRDSEEAVQAISARALGVLGGAQVEDGLMGVLASEDRAEWPRAEAALALERLGCQRAAPLAARVAKQAALSGLSTLWAHAAWAPESG